MSAFVYLLKCRDASLYAGWTTDVDRRLRQHRAGKASKYTRARLPVELVYVEELASRREAMRREIELKQLSREEKLALVGDRISGE